MSPISVGMDPNSELRPAILDATKELVRRRKTTQQNNRLRECKSDQNGTIVAMLGQTTMRLDSRQTDDDFLHTCNTVKEAMSPISVGMDPVNEFEAEI